ncbi:BtrH N-terminal domain-containing protein [Paenibacillus massiliensis]|uniref:BtrH N-terminal domain-containing protein n=1 Tax=Paenibacillus massiliensis TaxID=225917 RepID=UPI00036EC8C7|nr:BtrH N-terminal domain-containing protein [Paenibacillus massiliensis]
MTEQLYHNPRYNCIHVTLAAMLHKLGFDEELLFHQSGLYFLNEPDGDLPYVLDPYYRKFSDLIQCCFGVKVRTEEYMSLALCMDRIEQLITDGYPVGILVDIYSLEYSNSFNSKHYLHSIEITDYVEGMYRIFDHYYQHQEQVPPSKLAEWLMSCQENLSEQLLLLYHIDSSSRIVGQKHDYRDSLISNYEIMKGDRIGAYVDPSLAPGLVGIAAIMPYGEMLIEDIYLPPVERNKRCSHGYSSLKEISNSRHHCYNYLQKFGEHHLAGLYYAAHQSWMVLSNLLMRAAMYPNSQMEQRLQKRLSNIAEQEIVILNGIEREIINKL